MARRPRIVIAGAGYAGLAGYLALRAQVRARRLDVTLVNGDNWHLLLPELPLYLTGAEPEGELRLDLRRAVQPPARLVIAHVEAIEPGGAAVRCAGSAGRIGGDGLLLALGSVSSDFGVPGVAEHAVPVGAWGDAQHLRDRLLQELHSRTHSAVAVVGAGFTGVEIATALAERARAARATLEVVLVGQEVLPSLPPAVRAAATAALRRLEVRLASGRAAAVEAGLVRLEDGSAVRAETIVWAAGVRANPLLRACGLPVNHRGQVEVDEHLRAAQAVYCAGDCAAVRDAETGRTVAATAQLALQEGPGAALNLARELRGEAPRPVRPREHGFLVSLGRADAAGTLSGAAVHGGDIAALKRLIERYHAFQVGGLRGLARGLLRGVQDAAPARV